MMNENKKWLDHLKGTLPSDGFGNKLSMYLIALEAWRRGITVKFFNIDNPENKSLVRYSLVYTDKEYRFESSRGEKLATEAYEICNNKDQTKQLISNAGVNVPKGKRFKPTDENEKIIQYAEMIGFPLVLKPTDQNAGKGVFSNIKTIDDFKFHLEYIKNTLNYKDIIVEKYIPGTEYRVFLVQGKVLAATKRVPANVVGNGIDTIKELISEKNKEKKNNPSLAKKTIKIDDEILSSIKSFNYNLDSIPSAGEFVQLRNKSNVSTGGDPVDVTDMLSDNMKNIARKAADAIPGLDICGLDMIVDEKNDNGTVIEINTKPMLALHVFPMKGVARDVVKEMIDYYFPETTNSKKTNLYFDFEKVLAPLNNITTKQIELLPPKSLNNIFAKKFRLQGAGFNGGYKTWIRRNALNEEMNGYLKTINKETIEIVIASNNYDKVMEFKELYICKYEGIDIQNITESSWEFPVKIGFEIKGKPLKEMELESKLEKVKISKANIKKEVRIKNKIIQEAKNRNKILEQENHNLKNMNESFSREIEKLRDDLSNTTINYQYYKDIYEKILESRSWKMTSPFRKFMKWFRK